MEITTPPLTLQITNQLVIFLVVMVIVKKKKFLKISISSPKISKASPKITRNVCNILFEFLQKMRRNFFFRIKKNFLGALKKLKEIFKLFLVKLLT